MSNQTNRLLVLFLISTLFIFASVGGALAASGETDTSSHVNIKSNVDGLVGDLPPFLQEPVQWVVDNFFLIVVVGTVLFIWYYGLEESASKRSGSVAGQANAQKGQEHVAKKFIWSIVLSVLILFFASKYLL
jgi:hypothetical protein